MGAELALFDGDGSQVLARLETVEPTATVRAIGPVQQAASPHALHLIIGVPKGAALDRALRMATETGATHVHPVRSDRSVPRSDRGPRWQRILVSAAQQCGRADVPSLSPLQPLATALATLDLPTDRRVLMPGADPASPATGPAVVAVGPEGGFSPSELVHLLSLGWSAVGLGRWILRTDTAVAVALGSTAPRLD